VVAEAERRAQLRRLPRALGTTQFFGRQSAPATIAAAQEIMAASGGAAPDIGPTIIPSPYLRPCATSLMPLPRLGGVRPEGRKVCAQFFGRQSAPATIAAAQEIMAASGGAAPDIGRLGHAAVTSGAGATPTRPTGGRGRSPARASAGWRGGPGR
jgi:hypothetical protein